MSRKIFAVVFAALYFLPLTAIQTTSADAEQGFGKGEDWIINNTTVVENEVKILDGNLIVLNGGNLTFSNVTLIMNCSYDGQYNIEVRSGGAMYVLNGSDITSANPEYEFMWWVRAESKFEMRDSVLSECGWSYDNSGYICETEGVVITNVRVSECNYYSLAFYNTENISLENVTILDLWGEGLRIVNVANITVKNVKCNSVGIGIRMTSCENIVLENCVVWGATGNAILFEACRDALIQNVTVTNNNLGITATCDQSIHPSVNITLLNCYGYNNNYGHYFGFVNGCSVLNSVFSNNTEGLHTCGTSWDIHLENVTYAYNEDGAHLWDTHNAKITKSRFCWNQVGIRIYYKSSDNTITDNLIAENTNNGVVLTRYAFGDTPANNNFIYHNNFINNTQNAYDVCTNYWHNETLGEGNYWSDYTGADTNGDGIGDDPYYIPGGSNKDDYPLIFPYPIRRNAAILDYPKFENTATGIRISANITNTGNTDLANVTVNFSANENLISSQKIDLPKNTTKVATAIWQPQPGSYYVKVEVDPEKAVAEINEYDNSKEIGTDVFDFSIQKLTIPETQAGGYEINATVYTEGPSTVYANISVFINDTFYASQLPRLLHGNNTTVAFPWNPPTGDYSIVVKANANLFLYESNIVNNEKSIEAKIQRILPDLSIDSSDIYFSKDIPDEEENITITAFIKNLGYLQSQEAKVKFYDNDALFAEQSLQPISPGGQQPISTFWTAREGRTIKVVIDTLGYQEFNPNNNWAARYLTTTKKCDLAIGNITTDPSVPYEGKPAIIYAEVLNLGNATGEGVVSFYELGVLIGNTATGAIQPGSLVKVSVLWPSARSWRTITVRVVSLKKEKDMTNNEGYKIIEETIIGPKQDLAITAVYFDPSPPIYNETCRICVNLTNLGNATSVSALIGFYEGTNLIGNATISPVLPGGNDSCSINWIGKKGVTIYVIILAIEEDDIVNNAKSVYVSYAARSDIAVEAIRFSEDTPIDNETITVYADLRNIGDAPSKGAILKFYANDILIDQKEISPLQPNQSVSLYVLWNAQAKTSIKVTVEYEDTSAANNIAEKALLETTNPVPQPSLILPEAVTGVASLIALFAGLVAYVKRYAVVGIIGQTIRYKWLDKEKALKEEPRKSIYKFIFNNPRRSVTSMSKELGMAKSALRYHLDVLEYFGHLKAMHTGYAKIYWPTLEPLSGTLAIRERKITLTIASEPTPFEKIVSNVTERGESSEKVAEETEYILESMQERGLVETKYFGNTKYYSYTFPREAI